MQAKSNRPQAAFGSWAARPRCRTWGWGREAGPWQACSRSAMSWPGDPGLVPFLSESICRAEAWSV